jgi:hypothetical protein
VKKDPWDLVTEAVQQMKRNGDVMRADRLKQVMQHIDSSFDEKNVGKAKFSLFVAEAARRGLVSLNKLENGQLEVDLPKEAPAPAAEATPVPVPSAQPVRAAADEDRGRRGRGRGRDRDRGERPQREAKSETTAAPPAAPQAEAQKPQAPAKSRDGDEIGASGLRLTRDEAFDLVKRAVASITTGGKAAPSSKVRAEARSLLGRDSESLSERNFLRILHDAHDAVLIDFRKRGSDYEVAAAAAAPTVEKQLETAAKANAPAPRAVVPAPRGMGARGISRPGSAKGAPPPNLLTVGVVAPISAAPAAAPTNTAKAPEDAEAVKDAASVANGVSAAPKGRKRGGTAKKTTRKSAEGRPAGTAAKRGARKKTAAKTAAGSSAE